MIGYYKSPFGFVRYVYHDHIISQMSFMDDEPRELSYHDDINQALGDYFNGHLKTFKFTYELDKYTDFQKQVFQALLDIPFGETRSYKEIAMAIHRPKAYRAVGQACKKNPIGIMVPCHRVIGSDHKLTGYSGKKYIHLKQQLLELEKQFSKY